MIFFIISLCLFLPRVYFPEFSEEAFLLFSFAVSIAMIFRNRPGIRVPYICLVMIVIGCLYISDYEFSGRPLLLSLSVLPILLFTYSMGQLRPRYILVWYSLVLWVGWLDVFQVSHWWVGEVVPDSDMKLKSIFNQKNEFQLWNSLGIIYLAFLFPRLSNKHYRGIILLIAANALFFLLISKAKAAILVLFFLLVMVIVKKLYHRLIVLALLSICFVVIFTNVDSLPNTLKVRLALFEASYYLLKDYGWLGLGADGFAYYIREYFESVGSEWGISMLPIYRSPHNILLNYWVSFGVLGFLGIVINIVAAIIGFKKSNSKFLLMSYIVILGNSLVNEPTSTKFLSHTLFWVFTIRGVALNLNCSKYSLDINRLSLKIIMTLCMAVFSYQYFQFKLAEVDFFQFRHENFYEEGRIKSFDLKNHQIYSELNKQILFWDFIIQTRHGDLEEIKRAHTLLLEKTHNYFPWRHHLALGFAKNNLWGACEDNEAISLSMWSYDNVVSLNLMAKCKYHQNCQEFLKWKNLNEKYWVKKHDQQSFFWTIESCEIPDEPSKVL